MNPEPATTEPVSEQLTSPAEDVFAAAATRAPHGSPRFQWERMIGLLYLFLDLALWLIIYRAVGLVRQSIDSGQTGFFSAVAIVQFAALALSLFIIGAYDWRTNFLSLAYMSEHFITMTAAGCVGAIAVYAGASFEESVRPSRAVLFSSLALFTTMSLQCRRAIALRMIIKSASRFYVVLGTGELARTLYRALQKSSTPLRIRVVDPRPGAPRAGQSLDPETPGSPVVETVNSGDTALLIANSRGVIVAENKTDLSPTVMQWLTRIHFADTPVYSLDAFYEKHWRMVPVHALDPMWPLQVSSQLAGQSPYAHVKRLLDVIVAGAALLVLSPVFVLLTALTWWNDGKPALFRQTRTGQDGQPFTIYKFRTMHNRPPEAEGEMYTQTNDPRVTRLGRWLRKLRLDELPQLWNVLRGDMSLMGPRAEWNRLAAQYEETIPYYSFRHLVKPGVTGWAQVNYPYGASTEDAIEKLKYDLYYIRHCSLRLDAMIVFKTLHIMLWGKGH